MAVGARIEDLERLYDQLVASMQDTDAMITNVDNALAAANEEWRSQGATEFNDVWNNEFKKNLIALCQAYAAAGNDVAFQHEHFKTGAKEQGQHRDLAKVTSPR